jgi:Mg-chelatase subunit ChlI
LPIGSTEDRVIGSLDIERAIKEGVRSIQPGILAEANQNILYIDEVNLLPDHIIDDILDAAASGWNVVEREAVSMAHPSRFILIGTMNPEEGELRPQLLDRFALHVDVVGIFNQKDRVEIIERNLFFAEDPKAFAEKYRTQQEDLRKRILKARELLPRVTVLSKILQGIAQAMIQLQVDGHRPDIVTTASAKALAAFSERTEVLPEDVLAVAEMAQGHRTRRGGAEEPASSEEIKSAFAKAFGPEVLSK